MCFYTVLCARVGQEAIHEKDTILASFYPHSREERNPFPGMLCLPLMIPLYPGKKSKPGFIFRNVHNSSDPGQFLLIFGDQNLHAKSSNKFYPT